MGKIEKILFMGSKNLGLSVLKTIFCLTPEKLLGVLTFDDSNDGLRSKYDEFRAFCLENNIDFFVAKNKKQSKAIITSLQPDLCFCSGWYWIVDDDLLESVPFGFVGIHNSLLPKYRGSAPLYYAIMDGQSTVGASIFQLTSDVDKGDIWWQTSINVPEKFYIGEILYELKQKIVDDLKEYWLKFVNGELIPEKQDESLASYGTVRFPVDGKINWNKNAKEIDRFIRVLSRPYSGAYTSSNEHPDSIIIIWESEVVENEGKVYGTPGQIYKIDTDNSVIVVCGENSLLRIISVSLADNQYFQNKQSISTEPRNLIKKHCVRFF